MYCNFTKSQAFPLAIRASLQQPRCLVSFYIIPKKPQPFSLPISISNPKKPLFGSAAINYTTRSFGFLEKTHEHFQLIGAADRGSSVSFSQGCIGREKQVYSVKDGYFFPGVYLKRRNFSSSYARKAVEVTGAVKSLPWLARSKDKEAKRSVKLAAVKNVRSSWEESADKFLKGGVENREKSRRVDGRNGYKERSGNSRDESATRKNVRSSWEESTEKFLKNGSSEVQKREKTRTFERRNDFKERSRSNEDESDVESEEGEDPRWYKIRDRFDRYDKMVDVERKSDGPEFRKWNRQENWGKKTWKEATESSIPKMVGECVYGVGPVLAALSANRREFYVLYVQEGLDLNGNNKKKKDKKGFEKVLRVAEKLSLTKKEISKHDLNMIVDNRPHQGLVLDASPLEMVNIRELEPVVADAEEACPLWVALDEVMDPQNLGAIIRSSYFFGAAGVVLCAKNSAPLSGVVSKASAGSLELTELRSCKNMMQFLASSAENGWRILGGSVSSSAVPLHEVTAGEPTILVLGSEGTGLRPLVERSCTQLIKIPGNMPVHLNTGLEDVETEEFKSFIAVESLNVSVAAGVLLHHLAGTKNSKSGLDIEG